MKFGEILKELRQTRNLTQIELAKKINMTNQAISYYEKNERFPSDEKTLKDLANFFNVSVDFLIGNDKIKTLKKELTDEEIQLIEMFRDLPRKEKNDIMEYIDLKHERFEKNKKLSLSKNKKEA